MRNAIEPATAKAIADVSKKLQAAKRALNGIADMNAGDNKDTQDALCEATDDIENRLADIENALCELTEA